MVDHADETRPLIPARWRNHLYPLVLAVVPLLATYGIVADSDVPLWVALGAALLGAGTATAYRPSKTLK